MTWPAQLWHVFVKDVTEQRRLLLVYLVIVAIATLHALDWQPVTRPGFGATMVLVGLLGVILVGAMVQADSPTRSDAFWASHPFDASAVCAAKIIFALLVLGVAVIGQLIVIRTFDVHGVAALALAINAAAFYGAVTLLALVVAGLTRDLRGFGLGLVLVPVSLLLIALSSDVGRFHIHVPPAAIDPLKWAAVTAQLAIFVWLYQFRDARRAARIVGYAVCVLAVGAFTFNAPREPDERPNAAAPHAAISLTRRPDGAIVDRIGLSLQLVVRPEQQGYRYTLVDPVAKIKLRDGADLQFALSDVSFEAGGGASAMLPPAAGFKWIGTDPPSERRIGLHAGLSPVERQRIESGVQSVVVVARMVVSEIRPIATIPLREGVEIARHGLRIRIDRWAHDRGEPVLDMRVRQLAPERDRARPPWNRKPGYALINRDRREALGLEPLGSSMSMDGLVLPASTLFTESGQYGRGTSVRLDEAWLGGAELMVVGETEIALQLVRIELKD